MSIINLKNYTWVKAIALTLVFCLIYQTVAYADPDIFTPLEISSKKRNITKFLTGLTKRHALIPPSIFDNEKSLVSVKAKLLIELIENGNGRTKENLSLDGVRAALAEAGQGWVAELQHTTGRGEILISCMNGYILRYYNPSQTTHPYTNELVGQEEGATDVRINRNLCRQIMKMKALPVAEEDAVAVPATADRDEPKEPADNAEAVTAQISRAELATLIKKLTDSNKVTRKIAAHRLKELSEQGAILQTHPALWALRHGASWQDRTIFDYEKEERIRFWRQFKGSDVSIADVKQIVRDYCDLYGIAYPSNLSSLTTKKQLRGLIYHVIVPLRFWKLFGRLPIGDYSTVMDLPVWSSLEDRDMFLDVADWVTSESARAPPGYSRISHREFSSLTQIVEDVLNEPQPVQAQRPVQYALDFGEEDILIAEIGKGAEITLALENDVGRIAELSSLIYPHRAEEAKKAGGHDFSSGYRTIIAMSQGDAEIKPDILVCRVNGKVQGYITGSPVHGRTFELREMAVDPNFQEQGIGTKLFEIFIERLEGRGYTRFSCEIAGINEEMRSIANRFGFREKDENKFILDLEPTLALSDEEDISSIPIAPKPAMVTGFASSLFALGGIAGVAIAFYLNAHWLFAALPFILGVYFSVSAVRLFNLSRGPLNMLAHLSTSAPTRAGPPFDIHPSLQVALERELIESEKQTEDVLIVTGRDKNLAFSIRKGSSITKERIRKALESISPQDQRLILSHESIHRLPSILGSDLIAYVWTAVVAPFIWSKAVIVLNRLRDEQAEVAQAPEPSRQDERAEHIWERFLNKFGSNSIIGILQERKDEILDHLTRGRSIWVRGVEVRWNDTRDGFDGGRFSSEHQGEIVAFEVHPPEIVSTPRPNFLGLLRMYFTRYLPASPMNLWLEVGELLAWPSFGVLETVLLLTLTRVAEMQFGILSMSFLWMELSFVAFSAILAVTIVYARMNRTEKIKDAERPYQERRSGLAMSPEFKLREQLIQDRKWVAFWQVMVGFAFVMIYFLLATLLAQPHWAGLFGISAQGVVMAVLIISNLVSAYRNMIQFGNSRIIQERTVRWDRTVPKDVRTNFWSLLGIGQVIAGLLRAGVIAVIVKYISYTVELKSPHMLIERALSLFWIAIPFAVIYAVSKALLPIFVRQPFNPYIRITTPGTSYVVTKLNEGSGLVTYYDFGGGLKVKCLGDSNIRPVKDAKGEWLIFYPDRFNMVVCAGEGFKYKEGPGNLLYPWRHMWRWSNGSCRAELVQYGWQRRGLKAEEVGPGEFKITSEYSTNGNNNWVDRLLVQFEFDPAVREALETKRAEAEIRLKEEGVIYVWGFPVSYDPGEDRFIFEVEDFRKDLADEPVVIYSPEVRKYEVVEINAENRRLGLLDSIAPSGNTEEAGRLQEEASTAGSVKDRKDYLVYYHDAETGQSVAAAVVNVTCVCETWPERIVDIRSVKLPGIGELPIEEVIEFNANKIRVAKDDVSPETDRVLVGFRRAAPETPDAVYYEKDTDTFSQKWQLYRSFFRSRIFALGEIGWLLTNVFGGIIRVLVVLPYNFMGESFTRLAMTSFLAGIASSIVMVISSYVSYRKADEALQGDTSGAEGKLRKAWLWICTIRLASVLFKTILFPQIFIFLFNPATMPLTYTVFLFAASFIDTIEMSFVSMVWYSIFERELRHRFTKYWVGIGFGTFLNQILGVVSTGATLYFAGNFINNYHQQLSGYLQGVANIPPAVATPPTFGTGPLILVGASLVAYVVARLLLPLLSRRFALVRTKQEASGESMKTMLTAREGTGPIQYEDLVFDEKYDGLELQLEKSKRPVRGGEAQGDREKLQGLVYDALDALETETQGTEAEAILKDIIARNLKENRAPPVIRVVSSDNFTVNAARYIDINGNVEILLNKTFVETLLSAPSEYRSATKWLLAERLFHELGHDNSIGLAVEEKDEEKAQVFRDLILYTSCVYNKPLFDEIREYFTKEKPSFPSGNYFDERGLEYLAGLKENASTREDYEHLFYQISLFVSSRYYAEDAFTPSGFVVKAMPTGQRAGSNATNSAGRFFGAFALYGASFMIINLLVGMHIMPALVLFIPLALSISLLARGVSYKTSIAMFVASILLAVGILVIHPVGIAWVTGATTLTILGAMVSFSAGAMLKQLRSGREITILQRALLVILLLVTIFIPQYVRVQQELGAANDRAIRYKIPENADRAKARRTIRRPDWYRMGNEMRSGSRYIDKRDGQGFLYGPKLRTALMAMRELDPEMFSWMEANDVPIYRDGATPPWVAGYTGRMNRGYAYTFAPGGAGVRYNINPVEYSRQAIENAVRAGKVDIPIEEVQELTEEDLDTSSVANIYSVIEHETAHYRELWPYYDNWISEKILDNITMFKLIDIEKRAFNRAMEGKERAGYHVTFLDKFEYVQKAYNIQRMMIIFTTIIKDVFLILLVWFLSNPIRIVRGIRRGILSHCFIDYETYFLMSDVIGDIRSGKWRKTHRKLRDFVEERVSSVHDAIMYRIEWRPDALIVWRDIHMAFAAYAENVARDRQRKGDRELWEDTLRRLSALRPVVHRRDGLTARHLLNRYFDRNLYICGPARIDEQGNIAWPVTNMKPDSDTPHYWDEFERRATVGWLVIETAYANALRREGVRRVYLERRDRSQRNLSQDQIDRLFGGPIRPLKPHSTIAGPGVREEDHDNITNPMLERIFDGEKPGCYISDTEGSETRQSQEDNKLLADLRGLTLNYYKDTPEEAEASEDLKDTNIYLLDPDARSPPEARSYCLWQDVADPVARFVIGHAGRGLGGHFREGEFPAQQNGYLPLALMRQLMVDRAREKVRDNIGRYNYLTRVIALMVRHEARHAREKKLTNGETEEVEQEVAEMMRALHPYLSANQARLLEERFEEFGDKVAQILEHYGTFTAQEIEDSERLLESWRSSAVLTPIELWQLWSYLTLTGREMGEEYAQLHRDIVGLISEAFKNGKKDEQDIVPQIDGVVIGYPWRRSDPSMERAANIIDKKRALLERVAFRSGEVVLDLGCGGGEDSVDIARNNPEVMVYGIDARSENLKRAIAYADASIPGQSNIRFLQRDFRSNPENIPLRGIPLNDSSVDKILLLSDVFVGQSEEFIVSAWQEVLRVLKPGGQIIFFGSVGLVELEDLLGMKVEDYLIYHIVVKAYWGNLYSYIINVESKPPYAAAHRTYPQGSPAEFLKSILLTKDWPTPELQVLATRFKSGGALTISELQQLRFKNQENFGEGVFSYETVRIEIANLEEAGIVNIDRNSSTHKISLRKELKGKMPRYLVNRLCNIRIDAPSLQRSSRLSSQPLRHYDEVSKLQAEEVHALRQMVDKILGQSTLPDSSTTTQPAPVITAESKKGWHGVTTAFSGLASPKGSPAEALCDLFAHRSQIGINPITVRSAQGEWRRENTRTGKPYARVVIANELEALRRLGFLAIKDAPDSEPREPVRGKPNVYYLTNIFFQIQDEELVDRICDIDVEGDYVMQHCTYSESRLAMARDKITEHMRCTAPIDITHRQESDEILGRLRTAIEENRTNLNKMTDPEKAQWLFDWMDANKNCRDELFIRNMPPHMRSIPGIIREIDPSADPAALIAGLFHDIDRFFEGYYVHPSDGFKGGTPQYLHYKSNQHPRLSANFALKWLREAGVSDKVLGDVEILILRHETGITEEVAAENGFQQEAASDMNLLQRADSISQFIPELLINSYILLERDKGKGEGNAMIRYKYARLVPEDKIRADAFVAAGEETFRQSKEGVETLAVFQSIRSELMHTQGTAEGAKAPLGQPAVTVEPTEESVKMVAFIHDVLQPMTELYGWLAYVQDNLRPDADASEKEKFMAVYTLLDSIKVTQQERKRPYYHGRETGDWNAVVEDGKAFADELRQAYGAVKVYFTENPTRLDAITDPSVLEICRESFEGDFSAAALEFAESGLDMLDSYVMENIELGAFLGGFLQARGKEFHDKNIRIYFEKPQEGLIVKASRGGLRRILSNLLTNIPRYVEAGAEHKVTVRLKPSNGQVLIEVEDDAGGIRKPEMLEKVLDPETQTETKAIFVRGSSDKEDTGILSKGHGLATSRQFALSFGGDMDVDTEAGVGTTFKIILPQVEGKAEPGRIQAERFVENIRALAKEAKDNGEELLVGIDTEIGNLGDYAQNLLTILTELRQKEGLDNLTVIAGEGNVLSAHLNAYLEDALRAGRKVRAAAIVREDNRAKRMFNSLEGKSQIISVDDTRIMSEDGKTLNQFIPITRIVECALMRVLNKPYEPIPYVEEREEDGILKFIMLPPAQPLSEEELRRRYDEEAEFIGNA